MIRRTDPVIPKGDGRCFGIACDEHYILVSEYGKDGTDAELVMLKSRDELL